MKKAKVTAEEIAAVFLEHKEEILKLYKPNVCYVSEATERYVEKDEYGWLSPTITATMFCPTCGEWGETETKRFATHATTLYCPSCGKLYTEALVGDNRSITSRGYYTVVLTFGEVVYLAKTSMEFVYNDKCELDVENSALKFEALGYYNPTTKTKSKYVLKNKGMANEALVATTAQYSTLFYVSSYGYQCIDGKSLELIDKYPLSSMDKSFVTKKKEYGPTEPPEEAEECPHIKYKDIIQISVKTKETDCLTNDKIREAHCHICGREWMYTEKFGDGNELVLQCPYCGTIANDLIPNTAHSGERRGRFMFISDEEDKAIVKIVDVHTTADDYSVHPTIMMYFEFYHDGKSKGWRRTWSKTWEEYRYNQSGCDGGTDYCFVNSCDGLLKYTGVREAAECLNNNSLSLFSPDFATDLRVFIRNALLYEVMEKVAKEGLFPEWQESMHKSRYYTPIEFNAKANTVYEAFGISKSLLKYYKESKSQGDRAFTMRTLQRLYALDNTITGHDAWWADYYNVPFDCFESIKTLLPDMSIPQMISYLERVRLGQMFNPNVAIVQWRDYLEACISIGMDMTDRHVLYPRALKTEHDIVVAKQSFIKNEEKEKDFMNAVCKYAGLAYHKDDYFIKVPENMESMFEEGRKLSHCCGRYVDDVANGKAFVLFMRKKSAPDIPFLSIEVYPDMTVHQVRGKNDTPISVLAEKRAVRTFLFNWAKMKHLELVIS